MHWPLLAHLLLKWRTYFPSTPFVRVNLRSYKFLLGQSCMTNLSISECTYFVAQKKLLALFSSPKMQLSSLQSEVL